MVALCHFDTVIRKYLNWNTNQMILLWRRVLWKGNNEQKVLHIIATRIPSIILSLWQLLSSVTKSKFEKEKSDGGTRVIRFQAIIYEPKGECLSNRSD